MGTLIAPYVFVTIPSSPHLTMHIDASKCQQHMVAGELLMSATVCGLLTQCLGPTLQCETWSHNAFVKCQTITVTSC
jgi:hypothetical protein